MPHGRQKRLLVSSTPDLSRTLPCRACHSRRGAQRSAAECRPLESCARRAVGDMQWSSLGPGGACGEAHRSSKSTAQLRCPCWPCHGKVRFSAGRTAASCPFQASSAATVRERRRLRRRALAGDQWHRRASSCDHRRCRQAAAIYIYICCEGFYCETDEYMY